MEFDWVMKLIKLDVRSRWVLGTGPHKPHIWITRASARNELFQSQTFHASVTSQSLLIKLEMFTGKRHWQTSQAREARWRTLGSDGSAKQSCAQGEQFEYVREQVMSVLFHRNLWFVDLADESSRCIPSISSWNGLFLSEVQVFFLFERIWIRKTCIWNFRSVVIIMKGFPVIFFVIWSRNSYFSHWPCKANTPFVRYSNLHGCLHHLYHGHHQDHLEQEQEQQQKVIPKLFHTPHSRSNVLLAGMSIVTSHASM